MNMRHYPPLNISKKRNNNFFNNRHSFRIVCRYQRGNQNPYIEEQTTQWPKEKVQKDKQQSTQHTHKTKDRVTRTPLKTGSEFRCSGWVFKMKCWLQSVYLTKTCITIEIFFFVDNCTVWTFPVVCYWHNPNVYNRYISSDVIRCNEIDWLVTYQNSLQYTFFQYF